MIDPVGDDEQDVWANPTSLLRRLVANSQNFRLRWLRPSIPPKGTSSSPPSRQNQQSAAYRAFGERTNKLEDKMEEVYGQIILNQDAERVRKVRRVGNNRQTDGQEIDKMDGIDN